MRFTRKHWSAFTRGKPPSPWRISTFFLPLFERFTRVLLMSRDYRADGFTSRHFCRASRNPRTFPVCKSDTILTGQKRWPEFQSDSEKTKKKKKSDMITPTANVSTWPIFEFLSLSFVQLSYKKDENIHFRFLSDESYSCYYCFLLVKLIISYIIFVKGPLLHNRSLDRHFICIFLTSCAPVDN